MLALVPAFGASAQSYNYSNGENNTGTLTTTGSIVLNLASGSAIQSGVISGTGSIVVNNTSSYTGTLTFTGTNTYIGDTIVDFGTLAFSGTGTSTYDFSPYIGYNNGDNGTLVIFNGGQILTSNGFIGTNAGSTGLVTITGTGSSWNVDDRLYLGYSGTGSMTVSNGGSLVSGSSFVGYNTGSLGSVTVTGTGSTWTNTGTLSVSNSGSGTLTISNGGGVSDQNAYIAYGSISSGPESSVTVTDPGSTWTTSGTLTVGLTGAGILTIQNGGVVSSGDAYLGSHVGLVGGIGSVTVGGVGSSWMMNSGRLYVGNGGVGNLMIFGGGQVSDTFGYIATGGVGDVTVIGSGSAWINSNGLAVGYTAGAGELSISHGGLVSIAGGTGTLNLAENSGSNGTLSIGNGGLSGTLQASSVVGGAGTAVVDFYEGDAAYTFVPNLAGTLLVNQIGTGMTVLTGSNTYTGFTTVSTGTLAVGNNSALGTSAVNVSGGTLLIEQGFTVTNTVTLSGGSLAQQLGVNAQYSAVKPFTSNISGGVATTATLLGGQASSAATINGSFSKLSAALNDGMRVSDVFSFSGVAVVNGSTGQTDTFVLQLQLSPSLLNSSSYLAWLDPETNTWVNAVMGNIGGTATFINGAYNSGTDFQLGYYGLDLADGTVWAVVDHNSDFSVVNVVPEPSAWLLLGLGLGGLALSLRYRKQA